MCYALGVTGIKQYRYHLIALLTALFVCAIITQSVAFDRVKVSEGIKCELGISAQSALLLDVATGHVIYECNARKRRYPASLTKIMTALLIIERGKLDDVVTVSRNAAQVGESSAYLLEGERVTLRDLLYLIMVRSANDACVAAAEHIAGSVEAFVKLMNERAAELGAQDTHFVNPHGLHDSPHYTTAYDIARIARYALQYPLFRKVVATREWRLPATNKAPARAFRNRNQLLWSYPGADGVKTGFTVEAGRCLVATATRNGWQLMAVVMKSNDAFHDATQLLNYGFERFVSLPVARSSAPVVTLHVANASPSTITVVSLYDWFVVVPRDALRKVRWTIHEKPIKPPIQRGAVVAWMEVYAPGYSTHWLPLVTQQPVNWSREYLRRRALLRAGGLAIAILFMVILMVGKRRRSVSKKRMPSTTDFKW